MTAAARKLGPRCFGRANWRGLATLAGRDIRRSLREYRYSLIGPLVSNLLFLAVFQLALGKQDLQVGAIGFGEFLVAGLVMFAVCERAYGTASESILYDKMEGIFQDFLMAPLTPLERTVGYALSASATGLITGLVVLAAALPFVGLPAPTLLPLMFFAVIGAVILGLVGMIVGLWAERWDHQSAVANFLLLPLAFLSGAYYSTAALPEAGRAIIQFNPMFYAVDGFRAGLTGYHEGSLQRGAAVLLLLAAALGLLAYRLFRIGYKVKP
jgi:ABC-2 type transport system permease protein